MDPATCKQGEKGESPNVVPSGLLRATTRCGRSGVSGSSVSFGVPSGPLARRVPLHEPGI